ncbi:MAG: hypothetical protein J7K17_02010 [Candidatus Omnitrophica bacterium]|nr:hypothetical protein [Candidatus Omnitrophota bacterium]
MIKRKISIVVFLLIFFFMGCQTLPYRQQKGTLLKPSSLSRFEDLPVPENFIYLPLKSFVFERGNIRIGILKYVGKASSTSIVNFFKQNMPSHNWELLNIVEGGSAILNFRNQKESCIISIDYKGKKAFLTISLSPLEEPSL